MREEPDPKLAHAESPPVRIPTREGFLCLSLVCVLACLVVSPPLFFSRI